MKNVIPYSKEIIFKTNIGEISSISLEHEEEIVGNSIEGIFKVSGEYKTHEISINKENFSYALPFNIELDEDIDVSTIVVDIEDFNYSFTNDVLKVNIEFSVTGERIKEEKIEEEVKEEQEEQETRNEVVFDETILDKINEIENKKEEVKEETKVEKEENEQKDEEIVEEKSIIEQEYVTYHVHILKEEETIESICKMYNAQESIVSEYNDLTNIKTGDKLIIPEVQDE